MRYILIVLALGLLSCNNNQPKAQASNAQVAVTSDPLELQVYDFDGLEKFLYESDGKLHIVNFWATWCGPCVKELPYFEKLQKQYGGKDVEVLLISLDFPHQYDTKLKPFLKKHNIKSEVVALDDPDMNTWLPKVDKNWTGAIPATIIYNADKRQFYEQSFTYETLETEVKQFIN